MADAELTYQQAKDINERVIIGGESGGGGGQTGEKDGIVRLEQYHFMYSSRYRELRDGGSGGEGVEREGNPIRGGNKLMVIEGEGA